MGVARGCLWGRSQSLHAPAVEASGSIPAGNTPEVKDWTTRKNRQTKCERLTLATPELLRVLTRRRRLNQAGD